MARAAKPDMDAYATSKQHVLNAAITLGLRHPDSFPFAAQASAIHSGFHENPSRAHASGLPT
jgi:hypothetical protein